MKVGIVAGEASGDLLGAGLIQTMRQQQPDLSITGVGGYAMIAAGCDSLFDMESLSVMGLVEPLLHLPELFKIRNGLYQHFSKQRPDVFIGIDSPDFNLGLEYKLKKLGIPIVHYVSPSVWAWRRKRIFKIAKSVDLMLTLLPFEADFYRQHNVPVKFVGHPLADQIPLQPDKLAARQRLQIDPDKTIIALLPGSRRKEIHYLAELFIQTAQQCLHKNPNLIFITSAANEKRDQEFQDHVRKFVPNLPIIFFERQSHDVMAAADVVLVTSGTATLETMLFKRPMVIAYKMANLTYQIAKYLVKIPYIGLPNLLANELCVPEFIQDQATPIALADALLDYVEHPEKVEKLQDKFMELHLSLRCHASEQASDAIFELVKSRHAI